MSYNIYKEIKFNSCLELLSNLSSGIIRQQTSKILVGESARILEMTLRSVHHACVEREVSKCLRAALFANARKIDVSEFQVTN